MFKWYKPNLEKTNHFIKNNLKNIIFYLTKTIVFHLKLILM